MSLMNEQPSSTQIAALHRERYLLIHKRPVGPKTAERLFSLYEGLSMAQRPREMYTAGWAIAEAALVATDLHTDRRIHYIQSAQDCWEYSLELERAKTAERAWNKDWYPLRREEFRILSTLAGVEVLREIVSGKLTRESISAMHDSLVDIAMENSDELKMSRLHYGKEGRASNYRGVAYEQIALLGISRIKSTRLIPFVSFARSEEGIHYPSQTHDMQILSLRDNSIQSFAPFEVKTKQSLGFRNRYTDVGLISGTSLIGDGDGAIHDTVRLFDAERRGVATQDDTVQLQAITERVIHDLRHLKRPELYGKHCLGIMKCSLAQAA